MCYYKDSSDFYARAGSALNMTATDTGTVIEELKHRIVGRVHTKIILHIAAEIAGRGEDEEIGYLHDEFTPSHFRASGVDYNLDEVLILTIRSDKRPQMTFLSAALYE